MSNLYRKKILVTGGTGFIGSRLAERLALEEGAEVRVLVHNWHKAVWVSRANIELVYGDVAQPDILDEAISGCEIVYHCVGVGGTPEHCYKVNVIGTKNVVESCLRNKVKRLIYFSSQVVHGPTIIDAMNEEATLLKTGNPYADSKVDVEELLKNYTQNDGLEISIIRPTYVWGPLSTYYTIEVIQQMIQNQFKLVDGGSGDCNAVYVDNVVDLAILCGHHPKAKGMAFMITDGEEITWKEFWSYFAKMLNTNINACQSVPSSDTLSRQIRLTLKTSLMKTRDLFTSIISITENNHPLITRYSLKALRRVLKSIISTIEKHTPEMEPWDIKAYSSKGFISMNRSVETLGYIPRISVSQGMEQTEIWLKLQNYIK